MIIANDAGKSRTGGYLARIQIKCLDFIALKIDSPDGHSVRRRWMIRDSQCQIATKEPVLHVLSTTILRPAYGRMKRAISERPDAFAAWLALFETGGAGLRCCPSPFAEQRVWPKVTKGCPHGGVLGGRRDDAPPVAATLARAHKPATLPSEAQEPKGRRGYIHFAGAALEVVTQFEWHFFDPSLKRSAA